MCQSGLKSRGCFPHRSRRAEAAAADREPEFTMEKVPLAARSCPPRPRFPAQALGALDRLETLSLVGLNMTGNARGLSALSRLREETDHRFRPD